MVTEEEILELLAENERREQEIFGPYDPLTGVGCYGYGKDRVYMNIPDFFIPEMWVPKECMDSLLYRQLMMYGSIEKFILCYLGDETVTKEQIYNVTFNICIVRFREDPEFAMYFDMIVDKKSGDMVNFKLNYPQRYLLKAFEDLRHQGLPIFVILLKARQWGGSTLTQMYIKWMQDFRHPNGWNSIILGQVKSTAKRIKAMYRIAIERMPGWTLGLPSTELQMSPFENSQDDFVVSNGMTPIRTSTLTIASFDTFDNVRSANFHCAHFSEVAYWKKTPEHDPEGVCASVSGGLDPIADNIEVYESSGKGASGFFYDKCQEAMDEKSGSAYKFVFVPFYFIEKDMIEVDDKREFAEWLLKNKDRTTCPKGYREAGTFFWRLWNLGACFPAINWYRVNRNRFSAHATMATEAPIDEVEAFKNSGNLIFNPYTVDELKDMYMKPPTYYADIILPGQQKRNSDTIKRSNVRIREDGQGEMKIWNLPNHNILKMKNRYLVSVDIGGKGAESDYTVMTVLDCKGLAPGMNGKPQVVARWRSHCRHDILAWKAAALAHYYGDALLVIESNTADRMDRMNNTEGDHFGTIIEEIADYYDNIYIRSKGGDSVQETSEMKFGFQTNRLTKQWIIDNLIAFVDDKLWEEPDEEMYRELYKYERKDDGSLGNIEGKGNHDDVLMSTAIALWVCMNDMEKPDWIRENHTQKVDTVITEATV